MAQQIELDHKAGFAHITLNRPRAGNPISDPMLSRLTDMVDDLGRDGGLRAIVLRGKGDDFSVGRERPKKGRGKSRPTAYELHGRVMNRILGVYKAFRDCPAPVISVVQGRALGFGCALVGGSDLALASSAARFSLPEMAHGIAPTLAMSALYKVSPKALARMVYTMDEIDAATALAIGLVGQVTAPETLDDRLAVLLERLAGYEVVQIRAVKRYIRRGLDLEPEAAADLAGYTLATLNSRPR